jgi:hypothetical protein
MTNILADSLQSDGLKCVLLCSRASCDHRPLYFFMMPSHTTGTCNNHIKTVAHTNVHHKSLPGPRVKLDGNGTCYSTDIVRVLSQLRGSLLFCYNDARMLITLHIELTQFRTTPDDQKRVQSPIVKFSALAAAQ